MAQTEYDDGSFLYLLFTFQTFILLFLFFQILKLVHAEKRKEKGVVRTLVEIAVFSFFIFWYMKTFELLQESKGNTENFDPYEILGVP